MILSSEEKFKVRVFCLIMDEINESINIRFSEQKDLYLDLACFNPRRFPGSRKMEYQRLHLIKFAR